MSIETLNQTQLSALPRDQRAPATGAGRDTMATGATPETEEEGLSFWDVLDIINPLQHIPIVSTIYREITGDKIGDAARIAGGALFGGPIGLASAGVDFAVKAFTGKRMDEHIVAMVTGDDAAPPATANSPAVAEAATEVTRTAALAPPAAPVPAPAPASTPAAASTAQPASTETGKWFSLDGVERHNGFMPLGTLPKEADGPYRRTGEQPLRRDSVGTVDVIPLGKEPHTASPTAPAPNPAPIPGHLPLGLLQGVPEEPAQTQAAAQHARRAMDAQGLAPESPPARASVTQASAAPMAAAPVQVPAWFDSAMQKALTAYEKTGRLSGAE